MAAKRTRRRQRLPTVWRVPDDLWKRTAMLLPIEEFRPTRRRPLDSPTADPRRHRVRPADGLSVEGRSPEYGSGSTVHRRFQRWVELGCFEAIWRRLLQHYDDEIGLQWHWQSADASLHKAPLGGEKNRSQSHRSRQERHQAAPPHRRCRLPIAVALTAANRPDKEAIGVLLDARVVRAPSDVEQHLCLDKGYDYADAERAVRRRRYIPHIRRRGEERRACRRGTRARRWVVERTTSWFNRCRKLLIRWEKKPQNYLALVHLAAAIIVWRALVG